MKNVKNTVKRARRRAGMTQRQLAEACGTSQQQIQRIEAGAQTVRLDLALRIARALGATVAELFPGTKAAVRTLQKTKKYSVEKPFSNDPDVVREMDNAGVDVDFAAWTLKFRLRGGDWMQREISSGDKNRLSDALGRGPGGVGTDRAEFFVFTAGDWETLVNLEHLVAAHQLFDSPVGQVLANTDNDTGTDTDIEDERYVVRVHLAGVTEPIGFEVDPDICDEDGLGGQFHELIEMLEPGPQEEEVFLSFVDVDGERAWFRIAEVAMIEIPQWVLGRDDEDEEDGNEDERSAPQSTREPVA